AVFAPASPAGRLSGRESGHPGRVRVKPRRRAMRVGFPILAALLFAAAGRPLAAQAPAPTPAPAEDIQVVIKAGGERRLAVAVPALYAPGTAALKAKVVDPFTATLRSDLEYAGAFLVAEPGLYPTGFQDPTAPGAADR